RGGAPCEGGNRSKNVARPLPRKSVLVSKHHIERNSILMGRVQKPIQLHGRTWIRDSIEEVVHEVPEWLVLDKLSRRGTSLPARRFGPGALKQWPANQRPAPPAPYIGGPVLALSQPRRLHKARRRR